MSQELWSKAKYTWEIFLVIRMITYLFLKNHNIVTLHIPLIIALIFLFGSFKCLFPTTIFPNLLQEHFFFQSCILSTYCLPQGWDLKSEWMSELENQWISQYARERNKRNTTWMLWDVIRMWTFILAVLSSFYLECFSICPPCSPTPCQGLRSLTLTSNICLLTNTRTHTCSHTWTHMHTHTEATFPFLALKLFFMLLSFLGTT